MKNILGPLLLGALLAFCSTAFSQASDNPAPPSPSPAAASPTPTTKPEGSAVEPPSAPLLKNGQFELEMEGWKAGPGHVIEKSGGRNGTGALFYERTNIEDKAFCYQTLKLEQGKKYRFSAWMRCLRPPGDGDLRGATLGLEFYENGKFLRADYAAGVVSADDWTKVEKDAIVPDNATSARLVLMLRAGRMGKVWFDDVEIESDEPAIQISVISPSALTITPESGLVGLNVYGEGSEISKHTDVLQLRIDASVKGELLKTLTPPIAKMSNGSTQAQADLSGLPLGQVGLKLTLTDTRNGKTLAEETIPLTVAASDRPVPANACLIDGQGRAIVNGKPYLPVGLYIDNFSKEEIDRIGASPFNCIMPYHVMVGRMKKEQSATLDTIRECLDYSHEKGLKVLFGTQWVHEGMRAAITNWMGASGEDAVFTKVVESFKDHPSLLAWYLCDELPLSMKDRLEKQRALANHLDPFHPTWSIFYQFDDLPLYGGGQDVIGVDPYPIKFTESRDMRKVVTAMDAVDLTGLPAWVVPQAFNWGIFEAKDAGDFKRFVDPSEEQMRSMVLYMAARGAKGFVFYAGNLLAATEEVFYSPNRKRAKNAPAPQTEADFERRWRELSRVGSVLRELEPFLLADKPAPEVKVEVERGQVIAREFRDADGNARILIAGVGPGESHAIITTSDHRPPPPGSLWSRFLSLFSKPAPQPLKSLYGKCVPLGENQYRFTGQDICSDILAGDNSP